MSYSVLIIDDEPLICMGLLELIDWSSFGFDRTDIRFNFEDGMKAALSHPYTLVISDICLHDSNGLDLVRAVHKKTDTQFVLISAYAEFRYAQEALELGVVQYLLKPLQKEALENCIEKLLPKFPPLQVSEEQEQPEEQLQSADAPENEENERRTGITSIGKTLEYIHKNYTDTSLCLNKVANDLYVNSSYLGQRFRQQTGVKFTDYLNQYRIIKACELLLKEQYLTYEIGEMVGFGNISYFHRIFKRVTGMGTEEFKRKARRGLVEMPSLTKEAINKEGVQV